MNGLSTVRIGLPPYGLHVANARLCLSWLGAVGLGLFAHGLLLISPSFRQRGSNAVGAGIDTH